MSNDIIEKDVTALSVTKLNDKFTRVLKRMKAKVGEEDRKSVV